jgi:broad specificity phosphatase PhoE
MNLRRLLQGQGGYGLLPEGIADAEKAADGLRGRTISRLYSSDQRRALETARILRRRLKLSVPIRRSKALREVDYGDFTGLAESVVRRRCPEYRRDSGFVFPGGESFDQVQIRAFRWLDALLCGKPQGHVVVVTHGGWLRTLFAGLRGLPLDLCMRGSVAHGIAGRLEVSGTLSLRVERGVTIWPARL